MPRRPKPWYRKSHKCWYVTLGGVQHNLGRSKKSAYEHFYKLMRQPSPTPKSVAPDSLLVIAICDKYLDWVETNRAPDTYEWYRCRLQSFNNHHKGLIFSDLKPLHITDWLTINRQQAPTTRRNNIRAVKRCLRWALEEGYINENPIAHVKAPSSTPRENELTQSEFDSLLELIPNPNFRDLLVVTWETGCRPQESLRVEARHVDLKYSRWVFPKKEAKIKSMPRVVYLTDEATIITRRLMLKNPTGPLFLNSKGLPWNKDSVGCAFDRLQIRMGKANLQSKDFSVKEYRIQNLIPKLKQTRKTRGNEGS